MHNYEDKTFDVSNFCKLLVLYVASAIRSTAQIPYPYFDFWFFLNHKLDIHSFLWLLPPIGGEATYVVEMMTYDEV